MASLIGSDESIFVGIDVGTSKVCTLVGHLDQENRVRVIGVGVAPSKGMRKGGVVNLENLAHAVMTSKDKAERTSGYEITSAVVSVSGNQIESLNSTGMAGVSGRTVAYEDVARALDASRSVAIPYNRSIVHIVPRSYVVDGQDGIKSPLGMHGYRLEVEAHIVTAGSTNLRNLEKCIEAAGVGVDAWVLGSLASGEVVVTETEREMGAVVCDIGGGTADVAVYIEGSVWHTAVIPVGGDHVSNDISQGLHLPQETAESVKRRHAHSRPDELDPEQAFAVRPFGHEEPVHIRTQILAQIVEPRVEEIFSIIRQELKRSGYDGLLPAGLILTGGTSLLPGIRETASEVMQMPARVAAPESLLGLVDQIQSPAFSTGIGLLYWAHMQEEQNFFDGGGYGSFSWPRMDLTKAADFFKRLLPG